MSSPGKLIEELDANFKDNSGLVGDDGLRWFDVRELTLEGLGWPNESESFCRLPDRAQGVVRDEVWHLSHRSAGVCARFVTDSGTLAARWSLRNEKLAMPHMPASGVSGLELYAWDGSTLRWAANGRPSQFPDNFTGLLNLESSASREYCLYLPLYNGVTDVRIGVAAEAGLAPAPPRAQKPICFYGTSIVQGGCTSRPGMAYPAIISRALGCPHYNLGFSGNGKAEPEVAALLAELNPSVFVLDPLPNLQPEQVQERMGLFVETLHAARPHTPIVLVESISYQHSWLTDNQRPANSNRALREVYQQLGGGSAEYLHYVEGAALLGDDSEGTVDGVHATDVGFMRIAEALLPVLRPLLPNEKGD